MRHRPKSFFCLLLFLMAACTRHHGNSPQLLKADSLTGNDPEQALVLLDSLRPSVPHWPRSERMCYYLLRAKAQNKAYVPVEDDSLLREVAGYYDCHGSPNDRMLAHYLLGCAYRDMGQSPMAIDCYQAAVACADTTARNCDYRTLSAVYSQMAETYHGQLLLSLEMEARRRSARYAYLGADTLNALFEQEMIGGIYLLQHKNDSAEHALKEVIELYRRKGNTQESLKASILLMQLFRDMPEKSSHLARLVSEYDDRCDLFDKDHELPPGKRVFYFYKGRVFENRFLLDSAEHYYRKMAYPSMSLTVRNSMFKGLLSVFTKRHQPDSIAKYARLYCAVNDSSIALNDQGLTAQMAASYNYTRYQKEARQKEREIFVSQLVLISVIACTIVVVAYAFFFFLRLVRRHRQKEERIRRTYRRRESEMRLQHQCDIEELERQQRKKQEELDGLKKMAADYENNMMQLRQLENMLTQTERRQTITDEDYVARKRQLMEENARLRQEVEQLRIREEMATSIGESEIFANTGIYRRVKCAVRHPNEPLTEREWTQLAATFAVHYPQCYQDICQWQNKAVRLRIGILTAIGIRNGEQTTLLNVPKQTVANNMAAINLALFGENSARTLYSHLTNRYKIYIQ